MNSVISFTKPETQIQELRFELPSTTDLVAPLMSFFYTLLKNKGVDEATISNVVTAIIEAVANAMTHGNRSDIRKTTTLTVYMDEDSISVEVQDEGDGFDPEIVADPVAPENVMKPTGRGIFLMRSFMDKVDFDFHGKGTRIIMEKEFA